MKYIAHDNETGGIGHDKSLLTSYFAVLDKDFCLIDELYLHTKPQNGIYNITAEALSINGIDLIKHDKMALTESENGKLLRDFLIKNSDKGADKLQPLGHNVAFDLEFIYAKLLNKKEAQKYISYRVRDTGTVGAFLIDCGIIPSTVSGSLKSFSDYFKITPIGGLHDAEVDTWLSIEVYKEMIKLIKKS